MDPWDDMGDEGSVRTVDSSQFYHPRRPGDGVLVVGDGGVPGVVLQRQWVTLTASMAEGGGAASSTISTDKPPPATLAAAPDRVAALAAAFCAAAVVVCLLAAAILYRCCVVVMSGRRDKHFCLRKVDPSGKPPPPPQPMPAPCCAAVVAECSRAGGAGGAWGYSTRLLPPCQHWYPVTTQQQCTRCPGVCPVAATRGGIVVDSGGDKRSQLGSSRRQRPVSQPIPSNANINGEILPKSPLPEISEFSPNSPQYASSSILDEFGSKDETGEPTLKTRSLPAWVRSKPRPLSTEDDLNELYAKVNFSKKRKNRMRNDEAAIIALSKSRSQFLHKDTDSLVDNEAVIVYDERTAL